jgi:hypothetical protein
MAALSHKLGAALTPKLYPKDKAFFDKKINKTRAPWP